MAKPRESMPDSSSTVSSLKSLTSAVSRCSAVSRNAARIFSRKSFMFRFASSDELGCAAVSVLEADDVVFAEVAAGLDFDDFERNRAGVAQAVRFAQRNVGRLILGQQHGLVAASDFSRAAHDDPVLGAVMMFLQAQASLRIDQNALDLEAVGLVDAVVPAPGTMHLAVQRQFGAATGFERFDQL